MTKRLRTLETLGNLPYTTIDGGRWLKKALDPADIDVEIAGLPDTTTNARTVLNYQFQGDIPLPSPSTYDSNVIQSYDVDFYVYQNPILFGMSVSRPAGLKNLGGGLALRFYPNGEIGIPEGYSPVTVQCFENSQIEGDNQNTKIENLEKYCQKYRMIYGGVQCIPACSALFDSGTIEATQQIFSPKRDNVANVIDNSPNLNTVNTIFHCQTFNPNDFPDEGSSIQNPTTLYCRYKEGLYMPYKIRNPLVYEYRSSEDSCVNSSPFVITNEISASIYYNEGNPSELSTTTELDYNPATRKFEPIGTTYNHTTWAVTWRIGCYSKTGVKFYLIVEMKVEHGTELPSQLITLPSVIPSYPALIQNSPIGTTNVKINTYNALETTSSGEYRITKSLPYQECNVGIICFRSVGLQATIRVIFRMGIEMMITAGGIYSPFKHKAPKYDQKALSSYVRTTHCMRDAFLGNAATPEGHVEYANQLALMVASDEGTTVSNLGSSWYGRVSV